MKIRQALFLAMTGILFLASAEAQTKEFRQTLQFSPGETLRLKTFKGSIHVTSWSRPEVSIFARIEAPEDEDPGYAEAVVNATEVEVRQQGRGILIRSDSDDVPAQRKWLSTYKNLAFIHYEIQAPVEVNLQIEDHKSNIELYDLRGDLKLETFKGNLTASNLSGRIKVDTYKGRADLRGLSGSIDLETYKGVVVAEAIRIDEDSRLDTYKGEIELAVMADQGFFLDADVGRGNLDGNLVAGMSADEEGSSRRRRNRKFSGEIRSGGPRLEVNTYKGDIRLRQN